MPLYNPASAASSLTVEEEDGNPSVAGVTKIQVTNGQMIADGGTVVSLSIPSSGQPLSAGTAFPGSPADNDLFFRTDLDMIFAWNGTRWLCVCPHAVDVAMQHALLTVSTTNSLRATSQAAITATIWLTTLDVSIYVATTNDASNYWTVAWSGTSVTTQSLAADTVHRLTGTIDAVLTIATTKWFQVDYTKVSNPGAAYPLASIGYRYIGT